MSSLYKTFATNEQVEKEGVILEYGLNSAGKPIQIRVARAGGSNAKFAKALEAKTRPYRRQIQNETMDKDLELKVFMEVYVDSVILGWENVEDRAGKPLPFNRENCIKLLTDLPDLFHDIREQSQKSALFRAEIREIAAGN